MCDVREIVKNSRLLFVDGLGEVPLPSSRAKQKFSPDKTFAARMLNKKSVLKQKVFFFFFCFYLVADPQPQIQTSIVVFGAGVGILRGPGARTPPSFRFRYNFGPSG